MIRLPYRSRAEVRLGCDAALAYLRELIAAGWEYPDAHAKAATRFDIDGDELAAAYDNADSGNDDSDAESKRRGGAW
jgi:hypothetical protein